MHSPRTRHSQVSPCPLCGPCRPSQCGWADTGGLAGWTGPVAPGCLGGSAVSTAADWTLGLHFPGPGVSLGGCWAWLGPASGRDPYQQGVGPASTGPLRRRGSLSSGPLYPWLWKVCIGRRWCKSLLFRHFPESGILTREGCGLSLIQQSVPLISSA